MRRHTFTCRHCLHVVTVPPSTTSAMGICSHCGRSVTIPTDEQETEFRLKLNRRAEAARARNALRRTDCRRPNPEGQAPRLLHREAPVRQMPSPEAQSPRVPKQEVPVGRQVEKDPLWQQETDQAAAVLKELQKPRPSPVIQPGRTPDTPKQPPPRRSEEMTCQRCGSPMRATTVSSRSNSGVLLGIVAFIAGLLLFAGCPVVGWFVGIIICIAALSLGRTQRNVWKCKGCGFTLDRT